MEILSKAKDADKVLIERQAEINKTRKHVGKLKPHGGHKVWEVNETTLEVKEATFKRRDLIINFSKGRHSDRSEIDIKEGFFYTSALNKKNALKNFRKETTGGLPVGLLDITNPFQ